MIPLDEALGRLAWTQLWQVTLVAAGVGIAVRCCCRRRPHLAYLLWLVVLLKCLTPPLWSSPTSLFSWTVPRWTTARDTAGAATTRAELPAGQEATPKSVPIAGTAEMSAGAAPRSAADRLRHASGAPLRAPLTGRASAPAGTRMSLPLVLGFVWLVGVATHAGLVLWTVLRWWRTIRGSQIPVEPRLTALAEQLAHRLGIERPVRLIVTSQPVGPVTYGWLRAAIVLPQALVAARSTADLEPLLAHELVHVRRRDALIGLVQVVAQSLWWFHPLVGWANRRMIFERERCCDEEVLAALDVPPSRYADGLLSVLELKQSLRTPAALPGVRRLEITRQRLEHLLHGGHFQKRTPRRYWLILAAAVLLLVPGAGWSGSGEPGATNPPDDAKPASDAAKAEAEAPPAAAQTEPVHDAAPAAEPPDVPAGDLRIHLTNIRQQAGRDRGSVVLSFTIVEPVGTMFRIDYPLVGTYRACAIFATTSERAEVELSLGYRPEFTGDRNVDVLHSREESLKCEVSAREIHLLSMTNVASAPLLEVAPEDREITLIKRDDDFGAVTRFGGRRILLACPKSQAGQNPETMKIRSEIIVTRYEEKPTIPTMTAPGWLGNVVARQTHEIGSAHIEYRHVLGRESTLAPLSRDEVNKTLAAADLDKHPENFASAAAKLMLPEIMKERTEVVSMKGEFFSAGLNRRDQHAQYARVYDGEINLWYDGPNQQIGVYAAATSARAPTTINDFRIRFGMDMSGMDTVTTTQSFDFEARPDGRLRLWEKTADRRDEWVVDPATGFIERASLDAPNEAIDRFQFAPVRYPGGIVMPTLKISTRFVNGVLRFLEIWKIDKAEFNDGMPAGTFRLAAKAGTNLFLCGTDPWAPPTSVQIKADTDDVAEYLRGRSDLVPELRMYWPGVGVAR